MPWQWVSRLSRTLIVRLTFWNTLVVAGVLIVALWGVREGLRYYLTAENDTNLDDDVKTLLLALQQHYPDRERIISEMQRMAEGHRERGWHIRWLDEQRKSTIWASEQAPPVPLQTFVGHVDGRTVWTSDEYRSVERELQVPGLPRFLLRVGTSLKFVDRDVERVTRLLLPLGMGLLLLAPVGGFVLARQAIRPMRHIIETADKLRPSHMDERLNVRGVGDELDQLAAKINQFLDQIANHLQQNRDFLANAAHELRSPLAAIQSLLEVTLEKPRTPAEYEELLINVDNECRELSQLVNQLLQLAEHDAGLESPREVIELDQLTARCLELFTPVAEDKSLSVESLLQPGATVFGARAALRQVLTNLIDNAIKFTDKGRISVRVSADSIRKVVRVSIADTGVGIPSGDMQKVFDRFYQADRSRPRGDGRQGNGLGLSICRAIVSKHGGSIGVDSVAGQGTTFTVLLPLYSPETLSAA